MFALIVNATFTPKCPTVCCTQSKIQITDADPSKNMIIFFLLSSFLLPITCGLVGDVHTTILLFQEHLASYGIKFRGEDSFITDCLHSKPPILESAFPLHHPHEQEKIWKKMKQNVIVCPLQEIRDYYGN